VARCQAPNGLRTNVRRVVSPGSSREQARDGCWESTADRPFRTTLPRTPWARGTGQPCVRAQHTPIPAMMPHHAFGLFSRCATGTWHGV